MTAPLLAANVCTECDGTGRAAIETKPQGSQLGDCPACVAPCAICRVPYFVAAMKDRICPGCWALDFPMRDAGAQL